MVSVAIIYSFKHLFRESSLSVSLILAARNTGVNIYEIKAVFVCIKIVIKCIVVLSHAIS